MCVCIYIYMMKAYVRNENYQRFSTKTLFFKHYFFKMGCYENCLNTVLYELLLEVLVVICFHGDIHIFIVHKFHTPSYCIAEDLKNLTEICTSELIMKF